MLELSIIERVFLFDISKYVCIFFLCHCRIAGRCWYPVRSSLCFHANTISIAKGSNGASIFYTSIQECPSSCNIGIFSWAFCCHSHDSLLFMWMRQQNIHRYKKKNLYEVNIIQCIFILKGKHFIMLLVNVICFGSNHLDLLLFLMLVRH